MWSRDRHVLFVVGAALLVVMAIILLSRTRALHGVDPVALLVIGITVMFFTLGWIQWRSYGWRRSGISRSLPSPDATGYVPAMTVQEIAELDPSDFEMYMLDIYSALGYERLRFAGKLSDTASTIRGKDPRGREVTIGTLQRPPDRLVDVDALREFVDVLRNDQTAVRSYVTTAGFTQAAVLFGREHEIDLVDGERLITLRRRSGVLRH